MAEISIDEDTDDDKFCDESTDVNKVGFSSAEVIYEL